jgi:hypothetical protein
MVSSPEPRRWHDVLRSGEPWMTLMNLGEVTYIVEREHSAEAVEELWANLRARCAPAVASRFGGWTGGVGDPCGWQW